MLTVAIPKRNKLQNIIVLTPKDGKEYKEQVSSDVAAITIHPDLFPRMTILKNTL